MNGRTLLLLTATLLAACADYDSAEVVVLHADRNAHADREIVVGGAATVKITPRGRSKYSGTEAVDIRTDTPSVATARKTILADTWTILGEAPGSASFRVYVDGNPIDTFHFTVVPFGRDPNG